MINTRRLLVTYRYPWRKNERKGKWRRNKHSLYVQVFALEVVVWYGKA
jgi:hypothetical protein